MRNIWVTSDTHFNHENILNFKDSEGKPIRPFSSVEEMNAVMIENWNSVVKPGDKVYHLGDVFFGSKDAFKKLWPRLNGSKRLIVGNHDDIKFLSSGAFFQKVYLWRMWPEFNLVFSHIPLHQSQTQRFLSETKSRHLTNVHGHIHQNPSPEGRYINVCVEQTNYTPVNLEELRDA